ncbi:MAG: carboxypeptidase-like regulatory domain-containing protein [Candidatus Acidiferrales bacterium]
MILRTIRALGLALLVCLSALPLAAAPVSGKITGVVVDPAGTPQMGATVVVSSENPFSELPIELLTNDRGRFSTASLPTGMYSIKVTLAGFLPAIEPHIQVNDQHTTLLEIVLGSVFSSLEKMRRQPDQQLPADEWTWVLRSAGNMRPVLRWQEGEVVLDSQLNVPEAMQRIAGHGRLELTSGSDHPGSVSNFADSPATAFVYNFGIGPKAKLVMAGQFSYEGASPAGGFATEWLPSGEVGVGPVTTVVLRESRLGPDGPTFRGARMSHDNQFSVGDRVSIRYGAEYVVAGLGSTTMALHPRAEFAMQLGDGWLASVMVASRPWQDSAGTTSELQSALNALDAFPTLLIRDGRPVLEGNLHEEIAVEHSLGKNANVTGAIFHDHSSHTAVFGRGPVSGSDYLQDFFSDVFAYDAGSTSSAGMRFVYQQRFSDNLETTIVYAYAGALAPYEDPSELSLREQFSTQYRHSLAGRVTTTIPRFHTKLTASYKWINGPVVTHQDGFGESVYHLDPYLNMEIRQPLPSLFPGHMEASADVGNLLAQGYVPVATGDGQIILVPSYRYFRGGLSFQF